MGQLSNPTIAKKQKSSTFEGIACDEPQGQKLEVHHFFLVKIFTLLPNLKMNCDLSKSFLVGTVGKQNNN
jgi:hypothetical protein